VTPKKPIIILGLAPQGLALLRTFYRAGYDVLGIGLPGQAGLYSSCGKTIAVSPIQAVKDILQFHADESTIIHVTSDIFLNYLLDEYREAFDAYQIFPSCETAEIFTDKLKTQALANELGIPTPRSYRADKIKPTSFDVFPSILKWNRRYKETNFKTVILRSPFQMSKVLAALTGKDKSNLIVQGYLEAPLGSDISYGGYWEGGIERIGISIIQKRKFPPYGGLASCVVEDRTDTGFEAKRIAYKILEAMRYSGFVEVECRKNPSDGKVYLIEVNPRACGWIKILMDRFEKVVLAGSDVKPDRRTVWVNILRDLRAISALLAKGYYKEIIEAAIDYARWPVFDIADPRDFKPFIYQVKKLFGKKNAPV